MYVIDLQPVPTLRVIPGQKCTGKSDTENYLLTVVKLRYGGVRYSLIDRTIAAVHAQIVDFHHRCKPIVFE